MLPFQPFVLESYGAIGNSAADLLKKLKTLGPRPGLTIPAAEFGAYAARTIAVALQRGNGMVAHKAALAVRNPAPPRAGRKRRADLEEEEEKGQERDAEDSDDGDAPVEKDS